MKLAFNNRLLGPRPADAPEAADLRGSLIGGGLVLNKTDGQFQLYELDGVSLRPIGSFPDAAKAWQALDELEFAVTRELAA